MSFWQELQAYEDFDFDGFWRRTGPEDVRRVLAGENRRPMDFLTLLAPAAPAIWRRWPASPRILRRNFGNVILLIPHYTANHSC